MTITNISDVERELRAEIARLKEWSKLGLAALEYASTGNRRAELIAPAIAAFKQALAEQPAQDDSDLQDKDPELVEQPAQQQMPDDWFKGMPEEYRRAAWRIKEQPAPMIRGDIRDGLVDDEPAQQQPAPANLWLYWKVDDKSVVTGPFKTHSKDEAYGPDCIDQTPLTVAAPQPAQQEPVAKDDADIYEFWARNKETERQQKPMVYGKPWVGLDHDDIHALMNEYFYEGMQPSAIHFANFARAIEAKLKEKNT